MWCCCLILQDPLQRATEREEEEAAVASQRGQRTRSVAQTHPKHLLAIAGAAQDRGRALQATVAEAAFDTLVATAKCAGLMSKQCPRERT